MTSIDLNSAPLVLLDDSRPIHKAKPSRLFHSPEYVISAASFDDLGAAFEAIDQATQDGLYVAGWISYECARFFEPKLAASITEKASEPLVWMLATKHCNHLSPDDLGSLFHTSAHGTKRTADLLKGAPLQTEDDYLTALAAINDFIAAGDVYQINHTLPIPAKVSGSPLSLYGALRKRQPVAFGAYIDTGEEKVLSLSPELFLEKKGDLLRACPMKGTAPRGRTHQEDLNIQQTLKDDAKSQAENLMIVDLIRNDLSRISKAGSVKVPRLFEVEQYPTLHQMTSTVTASAKQDLRPSELLAAMFPCGSITGAPKVRAMEIIQSLEQAPRGVYCGTIGYFGPHRTDGSDNWCLNVPIRTLVLNNNGEGRMSVGSGVVADSDPKSEYRECLLKAKFTDTQPVDFSLIETMRHSDGAIHEQQSHINRLKSSARFFDFNFDHNAVEEALHEHSKTIPDDCCTRRVRLLMDKNGAVSITNEALAKNNSTLETVCLASTRTDTSDQFLFHKTTNRTLYNEAFAAAQNLGHADILFFNERDELTEGAISTIFVEKDGILYTPPISAGILPGVFRESLLSKRDDVTEKTLYRADLVSADKLYLGNALRGLRTVTLSSDIWNSQKSKTVATN